MKDIFTDFYNKVLGFFRQTEKKEESAKDVACNRLRVVLMQDRTNLSPELMERMRQELVDLLSKYVEMDKEALELNFEQEGSQMALMLSIPVLRAREESEIEKALSDEDAEKSEETETAETSEETEIEKEAEESESDENHQEDEAAEEEVSEEETQAEDENVSEDEADEETK